MPNTTKTHADFGFRRVPLERKQALVDDVFHSVARRYDLINDLMSGGLHRAWKAALVTAVNPPHGAQPFAVLDLAGGTGDVALRIASAAGTGTRVTVADINAEMLVVGRERAQAARRRVVFLKANAEALPLPDRVFDAVTVAFGIRNVPRIEAALAEAHRVLKLGGRFLCLEFSSVDVPGLDALYDAFSFNVIPALGRAVTGDAEAYRYLVESIRRFPRPESFARRCEEQASGACRSRAFPAASWRCIPAGGCDRDARERRPLRCRPGTRPPRVISAVPHLARLARAGFVFAREGVFAMADTMPLPLPARTAVRLARLVERPTRGSVENRLATALTRLGPAYVKLGQFLATRPDVVGPAIARDLEALQDKMPPFPQSEAEATVEAALGRPLRRAFVSFGPAVAAASIAQVHHAELAGPGDRGSVAVKVLRPGIERRFQVDIEAFTLAARIAEKLFAEARRLRLIETVATLRRGVAIEMDFRLEAAALSEMAENTKADPDFRVPAVDWDRTAKDVLTLEWIEGTPLHDRARLEVQGFDLKRLARAVIQTFLRHALRDGFFHADMHPGNLFVDAGGQLIVDFGIMGRLGPRERRFLAEILYGFITRDYHRTAEVHFEAGYVPPHHSVESFAQAIRAIGEPIYNRTAEEISMAKLLTLLFEVTGLFDMRTRPELLLLQKTMVVVEGVARSLDPRLDMWTVSEPVVREWIERHLGPAGRIEDAAQNAKGMLASVPGLLTRGAVLVDQLDAITRDGLVLAPETVHAMEASQRSRARWTVAGLWVIVVLLLWIAVSLLG